MSRSQATEPLDVTLLGKRVFTDVIKGLEMRPPWIIWAGPKASDKCPEKKGDDEAEAGGARPRGTGRWKLDRGRKDPPLAPLQGAGPCPHPDVGLLASCTVRIHLCCCEPPGL